MRELTRKKIDGYLAHIAHLNHIEDATQKFDVQPAVQQKLEKKLQESSAFLSQINMVGVKAQEGEKLGLGIGRPIASTTDTRKQGRKTQDLTTIDSHRYRAEQTNFDTHLTYSKLDAWAEFDNFQILIRDAIVQQEALDCIMIGFNGEKRAPTSDKDTHPLLQDVNIGWLQHYRNQAPERVLQEGKHSGQITIGPEGDYANLDALVFDAVNNLIDPWHQEDTRLVVICGRKLLQDKYFPIINANHSPHNMLAADVILSQRRIGHLPAISVPSFPANGLMVTRLKNLSLYSQISARRRRLVDNAEFDRIENRESSNYAYVVEDFGAGCVVENITFAKEHAGHPEEPIAA